MRNYIKPTISLASTASGARSVASCENQLSRKDTELILSLLGGDLTNAFATGDGCAAVVPIEGYCKFTSSEFVNGTQVFSS